MSVINKSNHKCRLCLVESQNDNMQELFSTRSVDKSGKQQTGPMKDDLARLPLHEKVEYCCGVKLHQKPEMPSKICEKCINMVDMWFNFRKMCFNSQEFLASQIKFTLGHDCPTDGNRELKEVREEIAQSHGIVVKDVDADNYFDVDFMQVINNDIVDDRQAVNDNEDDDDDGDDVADVDFLYSDNEDDSLYVYEKEKFDAQEQTNDHNALINQKAFQSDLSEGLSHEDLEEAMNYINPANDEYIEKLIDHCANKNTALRMLKRKAIASLMRERQPKKSPVKKETREKSTKPSMFMCNICGNVYSKKPLFQYHMRMHSEVKPYQCELCNKSYRIMSDLKNHMYRHTGERPFKCKHCDRHFMDRSSRHRHERVHTNSRPYQCNVCSKSFTYSAILKNHMKLHTGEKDYICAVCNKSFTLAHQLKAHMLTLTHRQKEAAFEAQGFKVIFESSELAKLVRN